MSKNTFIPTTKGLVSAHKSQDFTSDQKTQARTNIAAAASTHTHSADDIVSGALAKARQHAQTAYLDATSQVFAGAATFNGLLQINGAAGGASTYLQLLNNSGAIGILGSDASISGGNAADVGLSVYGDNELCLWVNSTRMVRVTDSGSTFNGAATFNGEGRFVDGIRLGNTGDNNWRLRRDNVVTGDLILGTYGTDLVRVTPSGVLIAKGLSAEGADNTYLLGVRGASYGIRMLTVPSAGAFIEAVDSTLSISYQPLELGGSTVVLATSGTNQVEVSSTATVFNNQVQLPSNGLGIMGGASNAAGMYFFGGETRFRTNGVDDTIVFKTGGAATFNGTVSATEFRPTVGSSDWSAASFSLSSNSLFVNSKSGYPGYLSHNATGILRWESDRVEIFPTAASTGVGTGALQVAGGIYAGAASVFQAATFNGDVFMQGVSGGWAKTYAFKGSAGTNLGGWGAVGTTDTLGYLWGGPAFNNYFIAHDGTSLSSKGINAYLEAPAGGWGAQYAFKGSSGTNRGGFGAVGSSDALSYYWIGPSFSSPYMTLDATKVAFEVSPQFKVDTWINSSEPNNRLFFGSGAATYIIGYGSTPIIARNGAGTNIFGAHSTGDFSIGTASAGNAYTRLLVYKSLNERNALTVRNDDTGSSATSELILQAGSSWGLKIGSSANNSNALEIREDALGANTLRFKMDTGGAATFSSTAKLGDYTVATLPSASAYTGYECNTTDSSVTTFGSTVAGGGSSNVKVRSNGTNWTVAGI